MRRVLFAAWIVVACGGPGPAREPAPGSAGSATVAPVPVDAATPPPALPLDEDLPRLARRAVTLYQDVATAFAAAGQDCAAATTRLRELTAVHADVVAANAKVLRDGRAMQLKLALRAHDQELDQAARAIMQGPTLPACSQDEAFAQAFDELVGAPP